MANITHLRLEGFQSHVNTNMELGPGLNVITGPSDSGKTAIIRAVRWIAFNEPTGEAFIHPAVGEATVTLTLDTGVTISKHRCRGRTTYILAEPNREPQTYEKAEVPEEVTAALGISEYKFGDFSAVLNIAYQLEAPFLISEPASAGAKVLGKLAGTEAVDLAIKSAASQYRTANADRQQAIKERDQLNVELLEYLHLDDLKTFQESAEKLFQMTVRLNFRRDKLITLQSDYTRATEDVERATRHVGRLAQVPALIERSTEIEIFHRIFEKLQELRRQWQQAQGQLQQAERTLEKLARIPYALRLLTAAEGESRRLKRLQDLADEYAAAKENWEAARSRFKRADQEEHSCRRELDALWASLEVCPLCELPVKESSRHGHSKSARSAEN
jgi:exonuclease SbcC